MKFSTALFRCWFRMLLVLLNIFFIYGLVRLYNWNPHSKIIHIKKYFSDIALADVQYTENHVNLRHSDSRRGPGYFKSCVPKSDIVYLKVHKAGSTSVMNILLRYGLHHKLVFALPKKHNYFNRKSQFDINIILPPPKGKRYNILCNHSVYNRSVFYSLFPLNTFYLAIIRQPFYQFVSAFSYYRVAKAVLKHKRSSVNPLRDYLKSPNQIPLSTALNFVNNRMSYDFGMAPEAFKNKTAIRNYIQTLDDDFDFVMILEYFEESLILLRRYLCWTMKDIISLKLNSRKTDATETSVEDYETHKDITTADYMLYEHYLQVFWLRVAAEGPSFFRELNHFKQVQIFVGKFCNGALHEDTIYIPASDWNTAFQMSRKDCKYVKMSEMTFLKIIRQLQYPK
ncbi:galactosylceramide sulfotransferase-like [Argonauta hians]